MDLNLKILTKKQLRLLEICYYAITITTDELIDAAVYKNIDPDETCEIGQSMEKIEVYNTSISTTLKLNNKDCTDPNIEW